MTTHRPGYCIVCDDARRHNIRPVSPRQVILWAIAFLLVGVVIVTLVALLFSARSLPYFVGSTLSPSEFVGTFDDGSVVRTGPAPRRASSIFPEEETPASESESRVPTQGPDVSPRPARDDPAVSSSSQGARIAEILEGTAVPA